MPADKKPSAHAKSSPAGGKTVDPKAEEMARKPSAEKVFDFHANCDLDSGPSAMHHTTGYGPNQAAPGDHTHDGGTSLALWTGVTLTDPAGTATNAELAAAIAALNALVRQKSS